MLQQSQLFLRVNNVSSICIYFNINCPFNRADNYVVSECAIWRKSRNFVRNPIMATTPIVPKVHGICGIGTV
jgi:hypothetical protein